MNKAKIISFEKKILIFNGLFLIEVAKELARLT